ncbi:MAG: acylphosphatase [Candidatus Firestonebacteria bacterium]|nr:acylphosphatase [Candidatus Firestonebacteria bacterium]
MVRRLQVRVRGQVQGVGYRYFVQRVARTLNLTGYVRNEPDGSVLVEAQGTETALQDLLRELQLGTSAARVERIKSDWLDVVKPDKEFIIRF